MKNRKGFTLIELLAVIVILGLLMAIAIPSVTKYITESRKKTVVSTIGNYITAMVNEVNDLTYTFTGDNTIYAVPIECIALERGGTNPFGAWHQSNNSYWAYVLVQYDDETSSYRYGYTFKDSAGYGLYPTTQAKLNEQGKQIQTGLELSKPTNGKVTTIASVDKWSGFAVNSTTELVVLEAAAEGEIGDGKTTCTLCQKGDNYAQVEDDKENTNGSNSGSENVGMVVVNSVSELTDALSSGKKTISVSSSVKELSLTSDFSISSGTKIILSSDVVIKTNGFKLNLLGGTLTVNGVLDLYGTIVVGNGNSTLDGKGTIKRMESKTMLNCQTEGSTLNISGITLDGGVEATTSKTAIAMIRNGAVVNVTNNAVVQNSKSSKDGSAAFNVGLGTLNLDGAIIRNNTLTASKGGAIYIRDGAVVNVKKAEVYGNVGNTGAFIGEDNQQGGCTVNIYNGANIYNNNSTSAGHSGVIYLRKTSKVNFAGGTFSNNSGIYSQDTGNSTANISGGVYNANNKTFFAGNNYASIINIFGNPVINVEGDKLVFANGNASGLTDDIIFVTGALTSGASINLNDASIEHILSRTDGYITKGVNYTITENDVAKFHSTNYIFKLDSVNNTIIVEKNS